MSSSFATPWTVALQAPLSMGFPKQEYWSGLPVPSLGDLPNPGIEPMSPAVQADYLPQSHQGSPSTLIDTIQISFGDSSSFPVLLRLQCLCDEDMDFFTSQSIHHLGDLILSDDF